MSCRRARRARRPDPAAPARAVRRRRGAGHEPDAWDRLEDGTTRVSAAMVDGRSTRSCASSRRTIEMPREFVVPGETRTSAALELARTILRRAERRAVALEPRRAGAGTLSATVSEPARRPALGPCPGGRTGRVTASAAVPTGETAQLGGKLGTRWARTRTPWPEPESVDTEPEPLRHAVDGVKASTLGVRPAAGSRPRSSPRRSPGCSPACC